MGSGGTPKVGACIRGILRPLPVIISGPLADLSTNAGFFYAGTFEKLDFSQASTTQSIIASATPIFLIHGTEDDHTPASESQELFAARPHNTQMWLVPHANHTQASSVAPIEFHDRVLAWFAQH